MPLRAMTEDASPVMKESRDTKPGKWLNTVKRRVWRPLAKVHVDVVRIWRGNGTSVFSRCQRESSRILLYSLHSKFNFMGF